MSLRTTKHLARTLERVVVLVGALLFSQGSARADILSLGADVRVGGAGGKGMFGARQQDAFQAGHGALAYGLVLGGELFFVDAWIAHDQFIKGGRVDGTWTQFMLGVDLNIDFGPPKARSKKGAGGYNAWFAELGMGLGFGVGTGRQVDPPLNNAQVTDKGVLFEARGVVAYRLTRLLSLGVALPVHFGFFTKSGNGAAANQSDQHYSAIGAAGLLNLRVNWNIK